MEVLKTKYFVTYYDFLSGVLEIYRNYGNIPFCTEDEEVRIIAVLLVEVIEVPLVYTALVLIFDP